MAFVNSQPFTIPKKVYTIKSGKGLHMSCLHNQKLYVVGFPFSAHATEVRRFADEMTDIRLANGTKPHIHHMHISKKININKLGCVVDEQCILDFLAIPLKESIGIAFAYDILRETDNQFIFEAQLFDPIASTQALRHKLDALDKKNST